MFAATPPSRILRRLCLPTAVVLLACQGVDPSERLVTIDELPDQSADAGIWESAPWTKPWIHFGAKQAVTIEHNLGYAPRLVQVYVGFKTDGCARDEDSAALLASGTLAILSMVDATTLKVRNSTGEDYCLRIVAQ